MIADGVRISVWFGDAVTVGRALASDALMDALGAHGPVVATLARGIEGFGLNRRLHAERLPDVSTDLPLVAEVVDRRERAGELLAAIDRTVPRGLVTIEEGVLVVAGPGLSDAGFPAGTGAAARLTVWCAAGERAAGAPAYRTVVELLRAHGAAGATVLPAVDGVLHGVRGRARLLATNARTPLAVHSVGSRDALRACLPALAGALPDPVALLEPVAWLKHDGERLEPLPVAVEANLWQAVHVYTRQSARVGGHALHHQLTRALREAGAAGVTTLLGDWGFSRDEARPFGDRLWRVASHRPAVSVYVDRPAKVAAVWPRLDELTARHGIVTASPVHGYRERAGTATGAGA